MECRTCEYEKGCFRALLYLHKYFGVDCNQGRKRRVVIQQTLDDVTVTLPLEETGATA